MGDRVRIEQVMVNLLRNALDATHGETEPRIDIILAAGETATLSVRDNGPGIDDLDTCSNPSTPPRSPATVSAWGWRSPRGSSATWAGA